MDKRQWPAPEAELRKAIATAAQNVIKHKYPDATPDNELMDKWLDAIMSLIHAYCEERERKTSVATAQLILNTCKYEGRELYLSSFAVEQLLKDIKNGDNSRKAITALKKAEQRLTNQEEGKNDAEPRT